MASIPLHMEVKEEIYILPLVSSSASASQIAARPLSLRRPQPSGLGSYVICVIVNTINTQLLFLLPTEGMIARKNKWIPVLLDPYANNKRNANTLLPFYLLPGVGLT